MAIVSNVDLINTYDGNFQVVSSRILPNEAPHDDEFAAQVICIETVRTLLASGLTTQEYNDMTNEAWFAVEAESIARAKLNVNAPVVSRLSDNDRHAATNQGGSYFEQGYVATMNIVSQEDKIQFTRIGGLQKLPLESVQAFSSQYPKRKPEC